MAINNVTGNTLLESGVFPPCRVATTGAITLAGLQTVDGVALIAGDRVLAWRQADQTTNGIYAASTGNWVRTTDARSSTQFFNGMAVVVAQGAISAGILYICTCTDDPVVVGTSQLTFLSQALFAAATSTTSATIATGAVSFATQANKPFFPNEWVLVYETSNPANVILAQVSSYAGTSLALNGTAIGGSGTHSDWTIVPTNSPASAGLMPPVGTGNVVGPSTALAGDVALFADATGKLLKESGFPFVPNFDTVTLATAATIPSIQNSVRTAGYATVGDGGAALYKRVGSAPAHAGKFQSADGTWWEISERIIDPRMLGAVCDGSDRTTELQNAVNVAGVLGGELRIPNTIVTGGLAFSGTITISNPMTISGVGSFNSMLLGSGSATQDMFIVTANNPVHFRDLWFNTTTANKTGGSGIKFNGSGGSPESNFSTIERCQFTNHQLALDFEVAAYWSVSNCIFQLFSSNSSIQVLVRNAASGDAGDSELVGCWFFGGFTNTTFLDWQSSGGLRIARNKFLGNGTAGVMVRIDAQGTTGTGIVSIVDNSFDSPATVALSITTANSSEFLTNFSIVGNRCDGSPTLAFFFIQKAAGSTIGAINISSNNFVGPAAVGVQVSLGDTILVNDNIFGGITAAVILNSVTAAIINGNLLGGGTLAPSSTSGTVLVGTNK